MTPEQEALVEKMIDLFVRKVPGTRLRNTLKV